MQERVIDALRCPSCHDVVCTHPNVKTGGYHVPRCCGYVLSVLEDWDEQMGRWHIKVVQIPQVEWDALDPESDSIIDELF